MLRETIKVDVLIIGGGGAGSRAAYEAKRYNPSLKVALVVDGVWGQCGSTVTVASETLGINAPLNAAGDGDSPEIFQKDMLETGLGIANQSLTSIIANESADRVLELIDLGVKFDQVNGQIRQRKLSGCTKARSLANGGQTGVSIVAKLREACLKNEVTVLEGIRILDLISYDGEVRGAKGIKEDVQIDILAKAVVLANGGAGANFPQNINYPSLRGDGYAMAYRAGATLTNMEFIQIGPGVVFPKIRFIIHSHMWNFLPRLRNSSGKEFLETYLPAGITKQEVCSLKSMSFPFSVRTNAKYVDIAISKEVAAGRGTVHGGVFFDVNHISQSELKARAPITYDTFLRNGVDLSTDSIEISPLVQSFNGGIKIDENAATNVPGLFAVGEASGGVHGADRPGGNNLCLGQVFGYRGGRAAAALAEHVSIAKNIQYRNEISISTEMEELKNIKNGLDKNLMVCRQKNSLTMLLKEIADYRQKNPKISLATDNGLVTTEIIVKSALLREESRGVHYREDFPSSNTQYAKASLIKRGRNGAAVAFWA